jgi:predicted dehydrogenase
MTGENNMAMRILHIGIGIRGRHWLSFVKDYPEAVSVACVDPNPAALEWVRQTYGPNHCQCFADLDTALRTVTADAALIASPPFLHAEHALKGLEAGLAVMVEKPFTCTVTEAGQVIERAETLGRPVVVAENFRFVPAERTVRKLMQDNLLGVISNVTLVDRRRMPSATQGPWMATMEYPQLQEIAVHHFDSLRSFFGRQPLSIAVHTWNPASSDYRHGACTTAQIEMAGDLHVQYLGTLTSHRFTYSLWVEGEKGLLWTNRKFVLWRPRGKRLFWPLKQVQVPRGDADPYPKEGTTTLLNSLRDAVLHGQQAETSGYDNIWTIAMVEAGKRSVAERRTIAIDEILTEATVGKSMREELLAHAATKGR